ncbi:hypothetical protein O1L60_23400 [Streptomyces diastatochromogenes]|nr:hypothetical protein [Streptomyces diastatochromogenes]
MRALAGAGRTEEARSLLAVAERNGADEGLGFVSALVAVGEVDRAEELATGGGLWVEPVIGARLAEGDFDAVVRLARNGGLPSGRTLAMAVRGLTEAGAWDRAVLLGREGSSFDQDRMSLITVAGMARAGRVHEAAHRLAGVGTAPTGDLGVTLLPERVRALLALGRREEAERLARPVRAETSRLSPAAHARYVVRALVVLGAHEEACRHAREADPRNVVQLLLSVAADLVREGAYEEAERILAGLHFAGLRCAAVYADLARDHPDPVRARECAALALHLGSWPEVLPTVLPRVPEAVPLVLEEAERLRRALEV